MGKISKVFGVGVKGSLEVFLNHDGFDAGDLIEGIVALHVTKPIETRDLVLNVKGSEKVAWVENPGENATYHKRRRDFLDDTCVIAAETSYEPGEYTIAFQYRLQDSLPASYVLKDRYVKWMSNLDASVCYKLKISLPVTTGFSSDLEVSRPVVVFQRRMAGPDRPFSIDATEKIRTLGLVSRGECTLSATLDKLECIAGDALLINISIHNQSTATMSNVKVKLREKLTIDVPRRKPYDGTKAICVLKVQGVHPGKRVDQVLQLPLVGGKERKPIHPTNTEGDYARWTYVLDIKCGFRMTTSVKVQVPITVLPPSQEQVIESSIEEARLASPRKDVRV